MIYELSVLQFSKMLRNLDTILAKIPAYADHKKIDVDVLLQSRLAPDQFNFVRQVQIACDAAKICISKLTGKDAPVHDDKETSLIQLRTRISDTLKFLSGFNEADFVNSKDKSVTTPRWEGKTLQGHEYLVQHSIPNVYFHITTAYQILRHNGMDVGKKDYLGALPFKA